MWWRNMDFKSKQKKTNHQHLGNERPQMTRLITPKHQLGTGPINRDALTHTTTNNWYTSSRGWKSTIPCKPYKPNKPQYTYAKPESHRYTINTIHISLSLFHYTCVHLDRISSFDIIKNDTHNLQTIPFITHLLEEKKFYTRNNTFNSLLLFFFECIELTPLT